MKAISAVIVTIMLLMISVSLIGVFYVFSSTIAGSSTSSGSAQVSQLTSQFTMCMRIDNINGNKIDLRNCGKGIIENKSLVVTMDDMKLGASTLTIQEDSFGTVNVTGLWQIAPGKHNLKISNGATYALALVDVQPNKDGLVGSWDFNEGSGTTANDGSGNGNVGTLKNGTTATCFVNGACPDWVDGKFGKGLQFDGIGDYVVVSNPVQLPLGASARSVYAWIKTSSSYNNILTYGSGSCTAKQVGLFVTSSGNFYTATWCNDFSTSKIVNDNRWYFVGFSISDNTYNVMAYVDGIAYSGTLTGSIPPNTQAGPLTISGSTWGRFNGIIDEVRIWNRALAPDDTIAMKQII